MLPIQKLFINYNRTVRTEKPRYIIIHDVGAVSTARNNRDYFAGANRGASADFFVDTNNIIQVIDYNNYYSWAIGDGRGKYGITNSNSVSIEMCLEENYQPSQNTIENTLDLTKYLMKELNIPASNVVRHYDASRKICPRSFNYNNWSKWNEFKKKLSQNCLNPFIKLDGGGTIVGSNLAINLIIKDYKEVDRVFGHIEGVNNALWAFDVNPPNNNYAKLQRNANQIAVYKGLKPNTEYKILASGYKNEKKVTETSIVLKTLGQQDKAEEKLYKVQVGAYRNKTYAENLKEELKRKGYEGFITE